MTRARSSESSAYRSVLKCFGREGWHLHRSLQEPDKAAEMRKFLESRIQILRQRFEEWVGSPLTTDRPYSWHQQQTLKYEAMGIPEDLSHYLHGEFDLETRMDAKIVSILADNQCQQVVRNMLGSNQYYVHFPPMIRFKLPLAPDSVVPVHQDFAYNGHLANFMTIWMPFVDIDEECGGLVVYEGSQLGELTEHRTSGNWANKSVADLSKYPAKHILMRAGDALMFPPTMFHESAPHRSTSKTRLSIDFRVFPQPTDTSKSYFDPVSKQVTRQH